uniref:Uncharacterized protein n=1 Tax=Chenopodium quinoa TaxID=63459 RepID=A0A803LQK7_CHEQI
MVNSEHPLAKAIIEYAKKFSEDKEHQTWAEAREFMAISGHGVKAIVNNKDILIENKSLMLNQGITIPVEAEKLLSKAEVISILKSMNVESIIVTGDNKGTANSIVEQVGIETVIAEAKPE